MNKFNGKRIRDMRIVLNTTGPELAERAGVTEGYISLLEDGVENNPTIGSIIKLAKGFNMTVSEFLSHCGVK